jgi:hypothetical protein
MIWLESLAQATGLPAAELRAACRCNRETFIKPLTILA